MVQTYFIRGKVSLRFLALSIMSYQILVNGSTVTSRPAKSHGFAVSLTDFRSILQSHGRQLDSHGNLFTSKILFCRQWFSYSWLHWSWKITKVVSTFCERIVTNDKTRPPDSLRTDQNKDAVRAMWIREFPNLIR